uniref:PQQ-binding-like beta-propeller repeat protein n=2 Tax=Methanobacterium TaxID=2160 RepID=UPI002FE2809F
KWNYTTDYPLNFNPVIGNDGTIYFGEGALPDTLYALNSDRTLKWSLPVQTTTAPVIGASGALYVGIVTDGLSGQIYSLLAIKSPYSPQNDPASNNSNDPVNTVNAASKTIKMQETGLPINWMVLAVLMVLGGLIQTKRN